MQNSKIKNSKEAYWNTGKIIVEAILTAVVYSMVILLLFAIFLKFVEFSSTSIWIINQILKISAILIGCVFIKTRIKIKLSYGIAVGFCYIISTYILFGLCANNLLFNLNFIFNVVFGVIIGIICTIIVRVK